MDILDGKCLEIYHHKDVTELFFALLDGEIEKERLPDGTYYRNKKVRIGGAFITKHEPLENEAGILIQMNDWIEMIDRKELC